MAEAARSASVPPVRAAGATDRGRVRDGNEDRVHVDAARGVFAVVDGVGGHAAGEVAATIAVDIISQRLARPLWSPEQRVREAIALANNEILAQASARPDRAGMTCVLTVALLTDQGVTIGHVGDTRLYRLDAQGIQKLTHDHSPIGEREDAGELGEAEAMRHPRRNEVFRDVGSAFHDPADPDFIEVIEAPFDEGHALLLCSDGLSDMLTTAAIDRVVRQHAGDSQAVVEALVLAANEAGGRDNVSVVYVEGASFAIGTRTAAAAGGQAAAPAAGPAPARRSFWTAPLTLLSAGLIAGLALGLVVAWVLAVDDPAAIAGPRILDVDVAGGQYTSIAAAVGEAQPRDTIRLAPGEYAEAVTLPDGVNLDAREPGAAVLVAPPQAPGGVAITAPGRFGHLIRGVRIVGTAGAPLRAGLVLSGHDVRVDDVTVEGTVDVGIDVVNDGSVAVRTSRLAGITGVPLRVGSRARPVVQRNLFQHGPGSGAVATELAPDSAAEVSDNVFVGFPELVGRDSGKRDQLTQQNLAVAPVRAAPRSGR